MAGVPIRTPAQVPVPLPLPVLISNQDGAETTVGFVVSRDERGVHFRCGGEIFIGEEAFASRVLSNLNRYPTRLAIRNVVPQLRCSHARIGWDSLPWVVVRDTQTWHAGEVWIHTRLIAQEQRRRVANDPNVEVVDVIMTDDDTDDTDDTDRTEILLSSDDDLDEFDDDDDDDAELLAEAAMLPGQRTVVVPLPPPPSTTECSVCACDTRGPGTLLKNVNTREAGWETRRVVPPCGYGEHTLCAGCLVRTATNWAHHSIGPTNHDAVLCPHEGCRGQYLVEDFARVLPARDMEKLRERKQRFSRSGAVRCPGCDQITHFNTNRLRDAQPGTVAQRCEHCDRITCYHCLAAITPGQLALSEIAGMPPCSCGIHPTRPRRGHINRWFRAPASAAGPLARNSELKASDCARQLRALCDAEEVTVSCAHCNTPMHRACACMELTHCGMKRCAVCGLSGMEHESVLIDHWDNTGLRGCPRWATDQFWSLAVGPWTGPKCEEGVCHSASHDCTDPSHAPYRAAVREVRRLRMMHTALCTLPSRKRDRVIRSLRGKSAEVFQRLQVARIHGGLI